MPEQSAAPGKFYNPAQQKALAWIQAQIQAGVWLHGEKLPSLDSLADHAGVARFTMWKVVRRLAKEKVLTAKRGSGITLGDKNESVHKKSWQNIAQEIANDIYSGEFSLGASLPPIVKLQIRYSVCYTTMYKALIYLVQQRLLKKIAKRYAVSPPQSSSLSTEVAFFNEGVEGHQNQALRIIMHQSEQQANRLGIRLVRFEHSYSDQFDPLKLHALVSRTAITGFVVDFWGAGTVDRERNFQFLMDSLYRSGKYLTILDHVGDLALQEPLKSSNRVLVLTAAGRIGGEDVGRYLLSAGHRHVAFLTTSSHPGWAQRRYSGLKKVFAVAGYPETSVTLYKTTPQPGVSPMVCAAVGISQQEMESLFASEMTPAELNEIVTAKARFVDELRLTKKEVEWVQQMVKHSIDLLAIATTINMANMIRKNAALCISNEFNPRFHSKIFNKLNEDREITAWVAATDGIGGLALAFLKDSTVGLSDKISVVSFDNSPEAMEKNLTSYEFNSQERVCHALSFAAGRIKPTFHRQQTIEWPGNVFKRLSSRNALTPPRVQRPGNS